MTKFKSSLIAAAALTIAFGASAWQRPEHGPLSAQAAWQRLRKVEPKFGVSAESARKRIAAPTTLSGANDLGYLQGPDGTTWYYTADYTTESIDLEGGYVQEKLIRAFNYTVYNSRFESVGSVADTLVLTGNEVRIAAVQPDITITQKFFNTDAAYEIMVAHSVNRDDYSLHLYTKVYSLGGAKDERGYSKCVATLEGMPVDALNIAPDAWSENYYMSFLTEQVPNVSDYTDFDEFLANYKQIVTTYKKGGYGGAPVQVHQFEIPILMLPGDQQTSPFYMICERQGKPAFVTSEYEQIPFTENYETGEVTAAVNNHLVIKTYTLPSLSAKDATLLSTTSIEVPAPEEGYAVNYLGVGNLTFKGDVDFSKDQPQFIISRMDQSITDPDQPQRSYYIYGADGNLINMLGEAVEGHVEMTELPGYDRQVLFTYGTQSSYLFAFVNLSDGSTALELPGKVDELLLSANIDRVLHGGKLYYVTRLLNPDTDEAGNVYERIGWFNEDGTVARVDRLNLGMDVINAMVYIDAEALSPYIFDTDDDFEYLVLVKRDQGATTVKVEELLVVDAKDGEIFKCVSSEARTMGNIALVNLATNPQLSLLFSTANSYEADNYSLPFSMYTGGDGTAQNPYLINTVGDLQQIKAHPSAHFALNADFDAKGFSWTPVENFSGSLDGRGHTIANLAINSSDSYVGLFRQTVDGVVVKDLNFINAVMNLNASGNAGLIAARTNGTTIENVNVYGLTVSGNNYDDKFGSLVGVAALGTKLRACNVAGARIDLPATACGGGIAGALMTGSSAKACAFTGSFIGRESIGGIVGEMKSDAEVSNSHVNGILSADNTIGGIVAYSERGRVANCYVEGTISANKPSKWTGPCAGGIVGSLKPDYEGLSEGAPVSNNLANLTALNVGQCGQERYKGQYATAHRIVGYSIANAEPEPISYDAEGNPVYDNNFVAALDSGICNNYATFAPVDTTLIGNNVEGLSISADEIGFDLLEELAWEFGNTADTPWNNLTANCPALYFETAIIIPAKTVAARVGEPFFIEIQLLTPYEVTEEDVLGDFMSDCDFEALEMTNNYNFDGRVLAIEFVASKEGSFPVSVSLLGSSASTVVLSQLISGVTAPEADNSLSFDGTAVHGHGAIDVYNLAGTRVASGNGSVSIAALPAGIYIARSADASLKIAR